MTMSKLNSPEEINFICSRMNLLGRHNHEWLDVTKATPAVRKKSKCFLSRFWKPTNLRLVPAFNRTLEFLLANKSTLMNPKYLEKNKEGLQHAFEYFSTKKNMRLRLSEFQSLIDDLISPPVVPTITREAIIADANMKSQKIIAEAEQKLQNAQKNSSEKIAELNAKLDKEKEDNSKLEKAMNLRTSKIDNRLQDIAEDLNTKALVKARVQIIQKKDLCDVILKTKDKKEIKVHSLLLKNVLTDPDLIKDATKDKPVTLTLFENYESSVVQKLCNQLYYDADLLSSPIQELMDYFDFLCGNQSIHMPEANHFCITALHENIEKLKVEDLMDLLFDFFERAEKNPTLLQLTLCSKITEKIAANNLRFTSLQRIRFFIHVSLKVSPANHQKVLDCLKKLIFDSETIHDSNRVWPVYRDFIDSVKKFAEYPEMKGLCGILLIHNPSATEKEKEEAVTLLTEAFEKREDLDAGYQLAQCYISGKGVKSDDMRAMDILFKLHAKNYPKGKLDLWALCITLEKMDERSFKFLEGFNGSSHPQHKVFFKLGECYRDGNYVQKDFSKAALYFRKGKEAAPIKSEELLATIPIKHFNDSANAGNEEDQMYMIDHFLDNLKSHNHLVTEKTISWLEKLSNDDSLLNQLIGSLYKFKSFYCLKARLILSICKMEEWGTGQSKEEGLNLFKANWELIPNIKYFDLKTIRDWQNIFITTVTINSEYPKIKQFILYTLFIEVFLNTDLQTKKFIDWLLQCADDSNLQSKDEEEILACLRAKWMHGELYYQGYFYQDADRLKKAKDIFYGVLELASVQSQRKLKGMDDDLKIMRARLNFYKF